MFKVLLIISAMGIEQEIQFPDMESCLEVRASVLEQVEDAQALCIPAGAEDLSMKRMDRFFNKFMEMIERLENRDFDPYLEDIPHNHEFN